MAHYNKEFKTPVYVHSHIRTFEETMRRAFDEKMVRDMLQQQIDTMAARTEEVIAMLRRYVGEFTEQGLDILGLASGETFSRFREAKESWRIVGEGLPKKAKLVDQVAARLAELDNRANDLTAQEFIDTVVPLYNTDFAASVADEFTRNIRRTAGVRVDEKKGGPPLNLNTYKVGNLIGRNGGTRLLDGLLNRTVKYGQERTAYVQKKYKDDHDKLKALVAEVQTFLNKAGTTKLSKDGIDTTLTTSMEKLSTLEGATSYTQSNYKGLLRLIDMNMGILMEAVVAMGMADQPRNATALQLATDSIALATGSAQRTVTSDVVAMVRGISIPLGVSVKSNLKQVFDHQVELKNNKQLFPDNDPTLPDKLIYFLVNYTNLQKWNVENNAAPAMKFKNDEPRQMPSEYAALYGDYMSLIQKSATIQSLLGSVFSDTALNLNSQDDISKYMKNAGTSVPLVLQVFDQSYYTYKILERVRDIAREGGGGFNVYLMNTNVKPGMKQLWDYKFSFIHSAMQAQGSRYFGGYPVLYDVVKEGGFLPSGDLRARVIIKLNDTFKGV